MYCELVCCVLLKQNVILCNAVVPRALCDRCSPVACKNLGISESALRLILISRKTTAVTLAQEILKAGFCDDAMSKSQKL